jgi:DNA-directed RNA polymerase beta' subunit
MKTMEDVMVHYNGNVRNSLGEIVQSLYGEDSFDAISVEKQKLVSMKISTMVMEKNYR